MLQHVISHPDTLITRFLGLHRVKPHKDKKAYIVVMFNVLYSAYFDIEELYDLKVLLACVHSCCAALT